MSKIKTRETVKNIKVLDKTAVAGERMKSAYIRSKDAARNLADDGQASPSEYAGDQVQYAASELSHDAACLAADGTKTAVGKGKEAFQRHRAAKKAEQARAEQTRQTEQTSGSGQTTQPAAQNPIEYPGPAEQHDTASSPIAPKVESPAPADRLHNASNGHLSPRVRHSAPLPRESDFAAEQPEQQRIVEQGRTLAKKQAGRRADDARTIKNKAEHSIKTSGHVEAGGTAPDIGQAAQPLEKAVSHSAAQAAPKSTGVAAHSAHSAHTARGHAAHSVKDAARPIKIMQRPERTIRQSVSSARKGAEHAARVAQDTARRVGKGGIKTATKGTVKTTRKTIKTARQTSRAAIKTSQATAKTAQKTAQTTAKAARAAAHAARAAAKAAVITAKAVAKTVAAAVKAIIAGVKALIAAIAAGGWVAILAVVVICLIGLIVGSCFGIFFSGEDSGTGQTMPDVVREINEDYEAKLEEIKASHPDATVEMYGSRAVWKEVLAIYAVKTTTDPENGQEVATMDEEKKELLKEIFWAMNVVSSRTETRQVTKTVETDDGNGNIVVTQTTVTQTFLYITISHKTAEEMADEYGFNDEQREQLAELLAEENNNLWMAALYGIGPGDSEIVAVALSQVGNVGGQPYWSWYGFASRVEWCACFVSWCANECGYIENGIIPKFAWCPSGAQWFKDRDLWQDNSYEPRPGDIIFFDWDSPNGSSGPQDGVSDHVGIVERVEDGRVYTIEGNSGDSCRQRSFAIGYYEIYGYGTPAY